MVMLVVCLYFYQQFINKIYY